MSHARSKYGNTRTRVGELAFDSKAEAAEWVKLSALARKGVIRNLTRQVSYLLTVNGVDVCTYRSDFEWDEVEGTTPEMRHVVSDKKGYRTREYLIKKRLMKACYGIDVREL